MAQVSHNNVDFVAARQWKLSAVPLAIQHHSYYSSTGNAPSPGTIQANSNVSAPTTATLSHPGSQGMSQQIDSQYTNISVAAAMNHQQ